MSADKPDGLMAPAVELKSMVIRVDTTKAFPKRFMFFSD
jgi:hypothetical protein